MTEEKTNVHVVEPEKKLQEYFTNSIKSRLQVLVTALQLTFTIVFYEIQFLWVETLHVHSTIVMVYKCY